MNIRWLKITDSTNLEAWRNKDSCDDMTVWAAEYQTEGRGQRGSRWESEAGNNLMFSILFRPKGLRAGSQFTMSRICAVGTALYLRDKGLEARVKWPNDVYVGDRKICGMLLENTLKGDMLADCIAGIGLNVNQRIFSPELPNPTSVLLETERLCGKAAGSLDIHQELELLLDRIGTLYSAMGPDGRVPGIDSGYEEMLYRLGVSAEYEETEYFTGGEAVRFTGRIVGVERETARLVVEHEDGRRVKYYFKEIRYVL
ncbi:MAG TPA: biotin--[acetyl-CoA-carboxylase] ligase [Candidatus Coprenecus stercoravium]|uniref:Biotin--[acetyl-CoA-carboxylase] ligase n=1 Tax=Candidatus Coprenecus stercoravium TaxID=2840735 RepID=A0A9D2GT19_9BACT|nr:biotin--[acetyl-CoA-carboxylase] ligase [Candidatus Coprenecus stercoravium]